MQTLLTVAQGELLRANADRRHPFRFFTLATLDQYPEVRTVVLRKANADFEILVFTDARSPKVYQITADSHVSALFYHPQKKLQLRIRAKALMLKPGSDEFLQYLNQAKSGPSVSDYTSVLAPGTILKKGEEAATGDSLNFQPIILKPVEIDVLSLSRKGHSRAQYRQDADKWQEEKLVP